MEGGGAAHALHGGLLAEALRLRGHVRTLGLTGAVRGWVLAALSRGNGMPLVCVTASEEAADALAGDLAFFFGGMGTRLKPTVLRLPVGELLPWDELVSQGGLAAERLVALYHLAWGTSFSALVLSVRALAQRVLPPAMLRRLSRLLKPGQPCAGRDGLARQLLAMGFRDVPLVEDCGHFSVRGDILDVFPPLYELPVRLEFFGDTLESLRRFHPQTQRTVAAVDAVMLTPARELFFDEGTRARLRRTVQNVAENAAVPTSQVRACLEGIQENAHPIGLASLAPGFFEGGLASVFDYLALWGAHPVLWRDEEAQQQWALERLWQDAEASHGRAMRRGALTLPPQAHFLRPEEIARQLTCLRSISGGGLSLDTSPQAPLTFHFASTATLRQSSGAEVEAARLATRLCGWCAAGFRVAVACTSSGEAAALQQLLTDTDVPSVLHACPMEVLPPADGAVHLYRGQLSAGFVDSAGKLVVLSDADIVGPRVRRETRRRRRRPPQQKAQFETGDLCVHRDFGLCRYQGLWTLRVDGIDADFLALQFAGKDKLYLPVGRIRLVSKFTGAQSEKRALDSLKSTSFERRKAILREGLLKMAADLLHLYAQRKAYPGHAFSAPNPYFRQFEAEFEFEETEDQHRAIQEVFADMEKPHPMDRLLCGDVGYGKTEVAMRAALKAVLDDKQVAVLVPTTLLAHQHWARFQTRFQRYPVTMDVLSSLRKPKEVRAALLRAKQGQVDILIGTHKLLNAAVDFRRLGLLIIDEEQKFGVRQKEALRRLQATVDTLTLTATPIPRSLNMALGGIRDMSIMATPPKDRHAIRTSVRTFDARHIQEAITREVQRGGQVFFIHNRVHSIRRMERFLRQLLPHLSLAVAHGKMSKGVLEKAMLDFVEGRAQLLLATSIIENGIDIPRANTMFIHRADAFGLAQLYQLRGRVGRSTERAYAYLLVPKTRALTAQARQRLEVLESLSELGAGFSIATKDLEIRGAGSLLGQAQSGGVEMVGFELYAQLLEEAVAEVKGLSPPEVVEPDVNLPISALLPQSYVPDVQQRLLFYRRFAQVETADELRDLQGEIVDRYGEMPPAGDALYEVTLLKLYLRQLALKQLDARRGCLVVTFGAKARVDEGLLKALLRKASGLYTLTADGKLSMTVAAQLQGMALLPPAHKLLKDLLDCQAP